MSCLPTVLNACCAAFEFQLQNQISVSAITWLLPPPTLISKPIREELAPSPATLLFSAFPVALEVDHAKSNVKEDISKRVKRERERGEIPKWNCL